jgi:ElaB/YqjD/DUF883 family membrane-anchored ribosome-binding protein
MASSMHRRSSRNHASTISDGIHELGAAAREVAADQVEAMRDRATDVLDHGRERLREVGASVETRFHDQPMKTVLIAAGIGFLLGMIWNRR